MERYLRQHNIALVDSNDKIRGRYITASKHIPKGSIIITSQPLGTVILPQANKDYCNYCFRKQPNLQRCSQCKQAYFCDMACFKNAWLSYHQYVCKKATTDTLVPEGRTRNEEHDMDSEMLQKVALNVLRFKKRMQQEEARRMHNTIDKEEETVEATMEAFFSLMGHDTLQNDKVKEKRRSLAKEVSEKLCMQEQGIHLSVEELVHYLNVFSANNFNIDDINMFPIGEGTYPIASLFNHSCRPNAVVMFDGAIAAIHAIEDIQPNSEITISYVDPAHSRSHRQKALKDKYFFACQCPRCGGGNSYLSLIDDILGEEESDWEKAEDLLLKLQSQQPQQSQTSKKRACILKHLEEWDLLEMCQKFDRKSDGNLQPNQSLDIASYTHYFIQFFAPYLLTWNRLDLHQQTTTVTSPPTTNFKEELNDFDDPLPSIARPKVPSTYDDIMDTCIRKIVSYANNSNKGNTNEIKPYRLSTLSTCTRLFYDEMGEGHWKNAVKLGMYILIQYCLVYPPYHPMLAQHFLVLAKACWNSIIQSELINDSLRLDKVYERGVRRWIVSSKETVSVAFGKHSQLWRETLELEWIFLREQKLK
ncbi:hypothetical protein BDF20DRAFT_839663 [Mycotypha africana]|uniref:uncharacterized protein n=1 Tax=Mycotypha africana TaxID=64632 RepID=UPI0023005018|nr:uncharacterized protein BDF20DRAFT_839663 [Mycotypha africana]KAI8968572.1 hypothetical protein BDF20DRAFT_839663 [Mycotypha africana]